MSFWVDIVVANLFKTQSMRLKCVRIPAIYTINVTSDLQDQGQNEDRVIFFKRTFIMRSTAAMLVWLCCMAVVCLSMSCIKCGMSLFCDCLLKKLIILFPFG